MGRIHVVPTAGGWVFKDERDDRVLGSYSTREAAERAARSHAADHDGLEVVVHDAGDEEGGR
jgi:hypothetical protein